MNHLCRGGDAELLHQVAVFCHVGLFKNDGFSNLCPGDRREHERRTFQVERLLTVRMWRVQEHAGSTREDERSCLTGIKGRQLVVNKPWECVKWQNHKVTVA